MDKRNAVVVWNIGYFLRQSEILCCSCNRILFLITVVRQFF